jgi:hypothetical protein
MRDKINRIINSGAAKRLGRMAPRPARRAAYRLLQKLQVAPAGNTLTVLPDDVFVVSYPRSGNTWLMFMLATLVKRKKVNFLNWTETLPDIYYCTNRQMLRLERPRLIKSHEPFDPRYPKVICLVRDGRDVMVSYYYFLKKFEHYAKRPGEFVAEFTWCDFSHYLSWAENVRSWLKNRGEVKGGFLLLRYEDLRNDVHAEMKNVLGFLGVRRSDAELDEAIGLYSLENMKRLEKESVQGDARFEKSDQSISFVRSGKEGSWKELLSEEEKEEVKAAFGDLLIELGYEKDGSW